MNLNDKNQSKLPTHLLNKADCKWGPWQPGKKCSKKNGKRRDTRDFIQGAMYGGKQCKGKHYRIVRCKGKSIISKSVDCYWNRKWYYEHVIHEIFFSISSLVRWYQSFNLNDKDASASRHLKRATSTINNTDYLQKYDFKLKVAPWLNIWFHVDLFNIFLTTT